MIPFDDDGLAFGSFHFVLDKVKVDELIKCRPEIPITVEEFTLGATIGQVSPALLLEVLQAHGAPD